MLPVVAIVLLMSAATLIRYGGRTAILAGALRSASIFIPDDNANVRREVLCPAIDTLLLLEVLAIYAYQHEAIGKVDFADFLTAFIGTASSIGQTALWAVCR